MLPLIIEVLIQEYAPLQDISTSYIKKLSLARSWKLEKNCYNSFWTWHTDHRI